MVRRSRNAQQALAQGRCVTLNPPLPFLPYRTLKNRESVVEDRALCCCTGAAEASPTPRSDGDGGAVGSLQVLELGFSRAVNPKRLGSDLWPFLCLTHIS